MKNYLGKFLVLLLLFMLIFTSSSTAYSFFDDLSSENSETIPVGEWMIGISTAQEFYDFATKTDSVSGDRYYLKNDIDFTGFTWELNSTNYNSVFLGSLNGNNYTISNLTIYTNSTAYSNIGIFPVINGASITNITFDSIVIDLGSTALSSSSLSAGIIAGSISGSTNTFSNITFTDCGVRGTSSNGVGGLFGNVSGTTTIVNINNIKASNLRVFNTESNSGGVIGLIGSNGATLNITNIDFEGEVYSDNDSSNVGGVVGQIQSGSYLSIDNAVVEITTQNTLETNSTYYLNYSHKYLGGFIGYNLTTSDKLSLNYTFFTGSLVTSAKNKAKYVGTLIGRDTGSYTSTDSYYSMVLFMNSRNGSITYNRDSKATGEFSILVNSSTMPSLTWWNSFSTGFDTSIWDQNASGRLYLIR